MNSSSHIAGRMTEMELAMAIGMNFKRTNNLEQSLQMRRAYSDLSYLDAVGHFVAHYGGGAEHGFPIVKLLATIEKSFSSSMLLGEEFFLNVPRADFGRKESCFPLIRACLVAANISSPKQKEGVARLLVPRCPLT